MFRGCITAQVRSGLLRRSGVVRTVSIVGVCPECLELLQLSFREARNKLFFDKAFEWPLEDQVCSGRQGGEIPSIFLGEAVCLIDDSLTPQVHRFVGRAGRPCLDWASKVQKAGAVKFGRQRTFETPLVRGNGAVADSAWWQELYNKFRS